MSIANQNDKFDLSESVTYLNTAYMSPLLKKVAKVGRDAIDRKCQPFTIGVNDFFDPLTELKKRFAQLIDCNEPERICIIPSVSYGIATVINNISLNKGDEILVLEEQFPSNLYSWQRLADDTGAILKIIAKPDVECNIGRIWNANILEAISEKTAVVAMCHTHWADGTLFDLKSIRQKSREVNALLIIDGTQSVGALPFSINDIEPDALICAGYKWLMGPYASGLAYYGSYFDDGRPIEENWANRLESENFAGLTSYQDLYKPLANRYNVGEQANFIAVPMLIAAIDQLIEWQPENIQNYCKKIAEKSLLQLMELGCTIESSQYRGHHLFGIKLALNIPLKPLQEEFKKRNIFVSIRGDYVRVSIHLFNSAEDIEALVDAIVTVQKNHALVF